MSYKNAAIVRGLYYRIFIDWGVGTMRKCALTEAKLGDRFPPVSYEVSSDIVDRFARVMGVSRHILGSTRLLPPSMLVYYVVWIACSHFAFQTEGALFSSLDIELERAAKDSGTITVKDGEVVEVCRKDGKRYITLAFVSVDEHGRTICRTRLTVVFKH
jgi:hypothetical protein